MNVIDSTYEEVPLDAVRPHPANPRRGDVDLIAGSIDSVGFYGHVIAQRSSGFIIAGEHRWKGARARNADRIPVLWLDVDDDQARRILLADNRTADLAAYDDRELADILEGFLGRLDATGYTADDLDDLLARLDAGVLPPQPSDAAFAPTPERDRPGVVREQQGIRDVPLTFQLADWREYLELLATLRRAWSVMPAPEIVLRALKAAAARD